MFLGSIWCQWCLQTDVLSGNQKTESAVLFRLLTQTIEAPKKEIKTVRMTNMQKEKVEKDNSEIKQQFPYVPAHFEHSVAADTHFQKN